MRVDGHSPGHLGTRHIRAPVRWGHDPVGILMPNIPDYVTALLASAKIGAVCVPINGRFKAHELSYVVDHADIEVLLVASDDHGTDYAGLVAGVFPELAGSEPGRLRLAGAPRLRAVVNLSGGTPGMLDRAAFDAGAATVEPGLVETLRTRVRVRDVALLMYTSGTTARLAQFEKAMPQAAVQVSSYGSTECATNLTLPLPDDPPEIRLRTLGRPVDGMEVKIVDPDTGAELAEDVLGELCFRGYAMFEGYYKDPEQTAATIDTDGWFHTGDRALVTDGANVVYGGRLKDMLPGATLTQEEGRSRRWCCGSGSPTSWPGPA